MKRHETGIDALGLGGSVVPSGVTVYDSDRAELKIYDPTSSDSNFAEELIANHFEQKRIKHFAQNDGLHVPVTPTTLVEPVEFGLDDIRKRALVLGAAGTRDLLFRDFMIVDASVTAMNDRILETDRKRIERLHRINNFGVAFLLSQDSASLSPEADARGTELGTHLSDRLDIPTLHIAAVELGPSSLDELRFIVGEAEKQGIVPAQQLN